MKKEIDTDMTLEKVYEKFPFLERLSDEDISQLFVALISVMIAQDTSLISALTSLKRIGNNK